MRKPDYQDALLEKMEFVDGITGAELQELYPRLKDLAPHTRLKTMAKYAVELKFEKEFLMRHNEDDKSSSSET